MRLTNSGALIERRLRQLETMLRIRYFEEKLDKLFAEGALGGTCHLCIGQEAAAVGVIGELRPGDKAVSSHRGHGHIIAMGGSVARLFAELMERESGYCRGRGGTQHLAAADIGFYGTNGITAGGLPIATGLALAAKRDGRGGVVAGFFGDGGINQGAFHEALNMAALWSLPVVYVCENNLYAMSTPIDRSMKNTDIASRAQAYGIVGMCADGTDIADVEARAEEAVHHARQGNGPVLLEIKTYRHKGHSKSDNRLYRTRAEEEHWQNRDCILKLKEALADLGCSDDTEKLERSVAEEVAAAHGEALNAPAADITRVSEGVRP